MHIGNRFRCHLAWNLIFPYFSFHLAVDNKIIIIDDELMTNGGVPCIMQIKTDKLHQKLHKELLNYWRNQ